MYKLLSMFVLYAVCPETKHTQTKRLKKYTLIPDIMHVNKRM